MKFYKYKYYSEIYKLKITAICCNYSYGISHKNNDYNSCNYYSIRFYKNGILNNFKNATFIVNNSYKEFRLNNKYYGDQDTFTKQSWRKFVKLQAFL